MYAVIDFKGHQYIVKEGDKIIVDKVAFKEGDVIDINHVLMLFDENGEKVELGTPYLNSKVLAKVVEHKKGEKIHVIKFKNKNRYSRKIGFRPQLTVLEIQKIS